MGGEIFEVAVYVMLAPDIYKFGYYTRTHIYVCMYVYIHIHIYTHMHARSQRNVYQSYFWSVYMYIG